MRWLVRQRTCPCCRREVKVKQLVHRHELRRQINRLQVKCKNVQEGCLVTVPLHHRRIHLLSCQYEPAPCPHPGCPAWVPRKDLSGHGQRCPHGRRPSARGCEAPLTAARAPRDYPHQLQEERRRRRRQASCQLLLAQLDRSLRHLRRAARGMHAQLARLGGRLERSRVDGLGPSA
ncbi:RING finger protein 151 isoform X1 [Ornithorhynchus anatinus]|nr:RING finger protein 151 isoform X1 [Ornithorhynchus anatinus]